MSLWERLTRKRPKVRKEGQEKALNEILMTRDRERITEMVLKMGGVTYDMLRHSLSVLESGKEEDARALVEEDIVVDRMETEIDRECFATASMRHPIQEDLRFVFSVVKLTGDIERLGDESVNIARHLLRNRSAWKTLEDLGEIPVILNLVLEQLQNALTALKNGDLLLARDVFERDAEIDRMYEALYDDFLSCAGGASSFRGASALALARHLERAGDHIANIAECVCFILTGERSSKDASAISGPRS